jgi:pimeloyl-ACP methyl ester carboxylesterase
MGRQDSVVLLSDGRLMEQWVPNSRLVWIDECGHFPMYEQTAQYLAAVQSFFRAGGGIDTDGAEYPPTE